MAPALRLKTVSVASSGKFGQQVADRLPSCLPDSATVAVADLPEAFAGNPDAVVYAMWRADAEAGARADELAHDRGIPWMPVVLDHLTLRMGPVTLPGEGPCFRCFDSRLVQHDIHGETTAALRKAYARAPSLGPSGFLPHQARLAAGLAAGLLSGTLAGTSPPGQVVTVRLPRLEISRDSVVTVHGCPRCRTEPPPRDVPALLRLNEPEALHA